MMQAVSTIAGMSDSIFLVGDDGSLTEACCTPYDAEAELQKLLADNTHLLPGAQIDRNKSAPLAAGQAGIPDREGGGSWWSIDHLLVDQDAVPTFVEVKRSSDTRSRREVVAQMLDYAANGAVFWTPAQLRGWFEADDPDGATERLLAVLGPSQDEPDAVAEAFWQMVGANLKEGRIRLIFVADEIPASLQRLVEFLNEQMPRVEVLAVEIRQYRAGGGESAALVPRLIGQTSRAQATKEQMATAAHRVTPWTASEVLETIYEGTVLKAPLLPRRSSTGPWRTRTSRSAVARESAIPLSRCPPIRVAHQSVTAGCCPFTAVRTANALSSRSESSVCARRRLTSAPKIKST